MNGPHIITPGQMGRMLEYSARIGPWTLPILNAIRAGHIGFTVLLRDQRAPLADMRRLDRPLLALLPDDDEFSCGPDGWRPALAAIHWTRSAMIHASAGEAQHYAAAVAGTMATGRLLLIETASRHVHAWAALLRGKPTLAILPRGGTHPVPGGEIRH